MLAFVKTTGSDVSGAVGNAGRPFATPQAAVNALSATGGSVIIDTGEFNSPTTTYSNIKLIGSGKPQYNWTIAQTALGTRTISTPTKLVGGTILKGEIAFVGKDNVGVYNLGIDVGSDYITAGGTENDGLEMRRDSGITDDGDTTFTAYNYLKGNEAKDLTILLSSSGSLFHACLMEGLYAPVVENVTVWGGVHGFAIKCIRGFFRQLAAYNNAANGLIVKCNNYAGCKEVTIDGYYFEGSSVGIRIHNKCTTTPLNDITIKNAVITGASTTVDIIADYGQGFNRISLHSIKGSGAFSGTGLVTNLSLVDCWNGSTAVTS